MKAVRVQANVVAEIIPDSALPVADWYGAAFAAQCVEAPDYVAQGWQYDPETGDFAAPAPNIQTPAQRREAAYDNDKRINWEGKLLTVTGAAQVWAYYAAEGDEETAAALTALIAEAKAAIRAEIPDEEVAT